MILIMNLWFGLYCISSSAFAGWYTEYMKMHNRSDIKFPWMNFTVKGQENFQTNLSIHIINTMNKHNFHRTNANMFCFPKSTFYASIRIFSSLPCSLIILNNEKTKFEIAWSQYLNTCTFQSMMNFCCVTMLHNTVL